MTRIMSAVLLCLLLITGCVQSGTEASRPVEASETPLLDKQVNEVDETEGLDHLDDQEVYMEETDISQPVDVTPPQGGQTDDALGIEKREGFLNTFGEDLRDKVIHQLNLALDEGEAIPFYQKDPFYEVRFVSDLDLGLRHLVVDLESFNRNFVVTLDISMQIGEVTYNLYDPEGTLQASGIVSEDVSVESCVIDGPQLGLWFLEILPSDGAEGYMTVAMYSER